MKTLLKELIGNNPIILGIISLLVTAFGICYIIGAVKNWDWLYEPDNSTCSWLYFWYCFNSNRDFCLL